MAGPAAGCGLPVIFIDALMVKIRDGVVASRPVYLAIGVDCEGAKRSRTREFLAGRKTEILCPA